MPGLVIILFTFHFFFSLFSIQDDRVHLATAIDTIRDTIAKSSEKKAAVLFTSKDKSPPMWNCLSYSPYFTGKVGFAMVMESTPGLSGVLGVTQHFPRIAIVSVEDEVQFSTTLYERHAVMQYEPIEEWLLDELKVPRAHPEMSDPDEAEVAKVYEPLTHFTHFTHSLTHPPTLVHSLTRSTHTGEACAGGGGCGEGNGGAKEAGRERREAQGEAVPHGRRLIL